MPDSLPSMYLIQVLTHLLFLVNSSETGTSQLLVQDKVEVGSQTSILYPNALLLAWLVEQDQALIKVTGIWLEDLQCDCFTMTTSA